MHEKFLTLFVFIAGSLRLSKRACPGGMLSGLSDLIDPDTIGKFACAHLTTFVVSQNPRK